jgi:hypothetical protein
MVCVFALFVSGCGGGGGSSSGSGEEPAVCTQVSMPEWINTDSDLSDADSIKKALSPFILADMLDGDDFDDNEPPSTGRIEKNTPLPVKMQTFTKRLKGISLNKPGRLLPMESQSGQWHYDCSLGGSISADYTITDENNREGTYRFDKCKDYGDIFEWLMDVTDEVAMTEPPSGFEESDETISINGTLALSFKNGDTDEIRAKQLKIEGQDDEGYGYIGANMTARLTFDENEVDVNADLEKTYTNVDFFYNGCLTYEEKEDDQLNEKIHISGTDTHVTLSVRSDDVSTSNEEEENIYLDINTTIDGYFYTNYQEKNKDPIVISIYTNELKSELTYTEEEDEDDANLTFTMEGKLGDDCLASVTTYNVQMGPKWNLSHMPTSGFIDLNNGQARVNFNESSADVTYNDGSSGWSAQNWSELTDSNCSESYKDAYMFIPRLLMLLD